jgi:PPK2 family polyphosphate:nucleotide phosphotransferase
MYAQLVKPDQKVNLSKYDPAEHAGLEKEVGLVETEAFGKELAELQELMYDAGKRSLLVVLQGRDTSGKDGTIRCLARYMNMQGCQVATFKQPTSLEVGHDFLWRIHPHAPKTGAATIFNRSHYEDVLVVRVHDLVPEDQWKARYKHINHFEKLLTDSGTLVVKFYLHISKEAQQERLMDREQVAKKAWKLSVGDWKERELWDKYTSAYEDALSKCSTEQAPWYIIPADHKWFRNLAVVQALAETLKPHKKQWLAQLKEIGKTAEKELTEYRAAAAKK